MRLLDAHAHAHTPRLEQIWGSIAVLFSIFFRFVSWGGLESLLGRLGSLLGGLESLLGGLGSLLGRLGAVLGRSWVVLGRPLGSKTVIFLRFFNGF